MKIISLTFILLISIAFAAFSQSAANYYNAGKASFDKANDLLSKADKTDKAAIGKIIALYKESAENYLKSKDVMPGLKYHANYCAGISLYNAALQYHNIGDDAKGYETMKQLLEIWPDYSGIRISDVTREKSITKKGYIYIFPAADSLGGYSTNYYMSRYLLSILSAKQNNPDDALKYAKEVADHFKNGPEIVSLMAYYVSHTLHKQGNACDAGNYAVNYLENLSKVDENEKDPSVKENNNELNEMERNIAAADSQGCLNKEKGEESVAILAELKAPRNPEPRMVYNLGENLFIRGSHSFKLIFSEYKLAMGQGDSTVAHIWDSRLNENRRHFSSADWRTLAEFYNNYLTKANLRDDAIKKAQKKELAEATHVLIGIDPTWIALGQYAAGIQVMGKFVSHEIRVGYVSGGIKPYLKSAADTDKVPLYLLTHYNGINFSYSFKIISKGEYDPNAYTYLGGEFRYSMRNYSDLLTYYNKADNTEQYHNVDLKPQAMAYDASLIFGEIIKGKKLFFELFGGIGVGYKSINYGNSAFNPAVDAVANAPFKSDLWNKLYVPARFGVKFGFVL